MSTTVMSACWPLQMPPTPKAVLISLADNSNDAGSCWPSISTICERTCFGRSAVIEAIHWLEASGYLSADRANGRHTSYQLTPQAGLFDGGKPVRQPNQSASRTSPPAEPVRQNNRSGSRSNQSASRTGPVRQPDTNRKEPSSRATIIPDFSSWPSVPSEQVLADWLDLRKRKKAKNSPTAMTRIGKQLHLAVAAGLTVDDCISEAVAREWRGFNVDWMPVAKEQQGKPWEPPPQKMPPPEAVAKAEAKHKLEGDLGYIRAQFENGQLTKEAAGDLARKAREAFESKWGKV